MTRHEDIESNLRVCPCCMLSYPESEFTMDEHWCDACCWDALETEALGELEQLEQEG